MSYLPSAAHFLFCPLCPGFPAGLGLRGHSRPIREQLSDVHRGQSWLKMPHTQNLPHTSFLLSLVLLKGKDYAKSRASTCPVCPSHYSVFQLDLSPYLELLQIMSVGKECFAPFIPADSLGSSAGGRAPLFSLWCVQTCVHGHNCFVDRSGHN